jgi:signal transduction histidine kinase
VEALDRVYRTGQPESRTEEQLFTRPTVFWTYTMWPVRAGDQLVGVMILVSVATKNLKLTVAMNEALVLGSVHQHELTEVAESSNVRLQAEIHERQKAEAALREAQQQLWDHAGQLEGLVAERTAELTVTNKELEAFVYSIAHDLRAPLRAMQGFSALVLGDAGTVLSEGSRDFVERIDQSAQFMDAMLSDLLAFSRISQPHLELAAVSLESVIGSVLARLQKEIQDTNACVECSGPWPEVLAHQGTLIHILFNLTGNALKFVRPPRLRLRAEEKAGFIRVWVEDNGVGIAPEYLEQIFRLFIRLDRGKYPGTGAGLALVQKGVERMGGRVGVESMPGQGSRFWIELAKAAPLAGKPR